MDASPFPVILPQTQRIESLLSFCGACRVSLMKRLLSILILLLILIPAPSYAIEGTCSWHGGVNCSAGADWDGSAVCVDGWRDSSERYSEQTMCQSFRYGCSNLQQIYEKYEMPKKLAEMEVLFHQIDTTSNACFAKAQTQTDIREQLIQTTQCSREYQTQESQYNLLSTEYDRLNAIANQECEESGRLELEQTKIKYGYYSPQTPPPAPASYTPLQSVKLETGPVMSNDERCKSLGFGDWFNTDTQNCDTCPYGETKDPNSNSCKTPNPKVTPSQSVEKSIPDKPKEPPKPNVSEAVPVKIKAVATTTETTSSIQVIATTTIPEPIPTPVPPVTIHEPLPQPKTFWTKLIDWFKFW